MAAVIVPVEDDSGAVRILKTFFGLKCHPQRLGGNDAVPEIPQEVIKIGLQYELPFSLDQEFKLV